MRRALVFGSFLGLCSLASACDVSSALAAGEGSEVAEVAAAEVAEAEALAVSASEADRFVGGYRFSGGQAQRTALQDAIEALVAELNVLIRSVARDKITETNPVFDRVTITRDGDRLTLSYDTLTNVCNLDGSASTVKGIDGSKLTCRLSMKGNALVHSVEGPRGGRVNTFTVDGGRRLRMKTRIHSRHMPRDLRYNLTFSSR